MGCSIRFYHERTPGERQNQTRTAAEKKDIQIHQDRISDIEIQKAKLIEELSDIKKSSLEAQGRIITLQRIIDAVIIPTKEYVLYASEYMKGWITFVNEKLHISMHEKLFFKLNVLPVTTKTLKAQEPAKIRKILFMSLLYNPLHHEVNITKHITAALNYSYFCERR